MRPRNSDADVVQELAKTFEPKPGVYSVEFPSEQIRQIQRGAERATTVLLGVSVVLILASSVLIFIAIQTAVFSRRQEIEVMRLVGATNWYIRTPFLIEGLVQGLLGAVIAGSGLGILTALVVGEEGWLNNTILEKFAWTTANLTGTLIWLGLIGVGVGVVSSFAHRWAVGGLSRTRRLVAGRPRWPPPAPGPPAAGPSARRPGLRRPARPAGS